MGLRRHFFIACVADKPFEEIKSVVGEGQACLNTRFPDMGIFKGMTLRTNSLVDQSKRSSVVNLGAESTPKQPHAIA